MCCSKHTLLAKMCDGTDYVSCMRTDCFWCEPTGLCFDAGCATNTTALCQGTLDGYKGFYEDSCGDQTPYLIMCIVSFIWLLALFFFTLYLVSRRKTRAMVWWGVGQGLLGFSAFLVLAWDRDILRSVIIQLTLTIVSIAVAYGIRKTAKPPDDTVEEDTPLLTVNV